jgi:predicted acylesterase/phospholipase RssA
MSIPFVFFPMEVEGRRVFVGGLRNNFPLQRFLSDFPGAPFIALYLGKPDQGSRRWIGSELLDIMIDGEERQTVDKHREHVIVIDTSPVGTVDFGLTAAEKDFLVTAGKAAALRFLLTRNLDQGPTPDQVEKAEFEAEAARRKVQRQRARRLRSLLIVSVLVLGVLSLALWRCYA